jgi:PBP1b-binding outer membrane lipoprotein LpoB
MKMLKNLRKNLLLAVGVLLFAFVLSGCSNNENLEKNVSTTPTQEIIQQTVEALPEQSQETIEAEVITPEPITEIKEEIKTESISFKTIKKEDSTVESGKAVTKQKGVNGLREFIYNVTYTDGDETNRELISENIKVNSVDEIIVSGTKKATVSTSVSSCGEDYYKNVDGNCVHRPSDSPSGASAKCKDGTYSYSQNRRGTCSSHGGVAQWL